MFIFSCIASAYYCATQLTSSFYIYNWTLTWKLLLLQKEKKNYNENAHIGSLCKTCENKLPNIIHLNEYKMCCSAFFRWANGQSKPFATTLWRAHCWPMCNSASHSFATTPILMRRSRFFIILYRGIVKDFNGHIGFYLLCL